LNQDRLTLFEARAKVIKAMGHSARLLVIDELGKGERNVAELTALVGLDISTVSKHLTTLRNAGIVASDKRGAQVYYRLQVPCILNFFGCVEAVMRSTAEEQARLISD
jgi:DNA-binding transcriptional ArsR family regulator